MNALLLLLACAEVPYDAVDLQLDVLAGLPEEAEKMRICVEGRGIREQGAGTGKGVFVGLPAEVAATVRVVALDAEGAALASAGPETLDADRPWAEVEVDGEPETCDDPGEPAPSGAATWVLGVRFAGSSR